MKIIVPRFEIIEQKTDNLDTIFSDMLKHIEICGRTCYKSEDKITDTSYEKFVEMLTKSKHGAMLEHGTVYLTIPIGGPIEDTEYMWKHDIISFFKQNKFSVVRTTTKTIDYTLELIEGHPTTASQKVDLYLITTNWRVIVESKDKAIVKYFLNNFHVEKETLENSALQWITPPTPKHEKRYTVRFTYHLAVARDVNRHRVQSVGEESTRYCNYSKEKFGKELNIIEPIWFTDEEKEILHNESDHMSFQEMCALIGRGADFSAMKQVDYWMFANMACEYAYMMNTTQFGENNWNAQKGSLMLPLDTKTESIHTAFASDWCHFFNLRALGTTGAPRPSAKEVAWPLMNEFIDRQYITLDDIDTEKYYKIIEEFGNNIDEYIKK